MRPLLATAALLAVVGPLAACESAPSSSDAPEAVDSQAVAARAGAEDADDALAFDGADWEGWTGVYGDVRPVTDGAVDELVARVHSLNDTSWTAVETLTGAEIAYTPDHARVTAGPVAVHFDPGVEDLADQLLSVCVAGADCRSAQELEDDPSAAGLFAQVGPAVSGFLSTQLLVAHDVEGLLDEGVVSLSTVASPAGDLDCLAHAREEPDVAGLEGSQREPWRGGGDERPFPSLCVDERGLVVLGTGESSGMQYSSWRPGVDGDVTELVPPAVAEAPPPSPGGELADMFWGTWDPVYTDVRPATEAAVGALRGRVEALGRSEWTLVDATYGTEISYTPERVRIRIADLMDAFADPFDTSEPWQLVICGERQCVDSRRLAGEGTPHLTSSFSDGIIFTALAAAKAQARPSLRLVEHAVLATVESPVGPLDCLVHGARADDVATDVLEGAPLSVDPARPVDPADGPFVVPQCVDSRGLLIVSGASMFPVVQVQSWSPGVDGDLDYPHPVKR